MPSLSAPHLFHPPSDLIGGEWTPIPGTTLTSVSPAAPAEVVFACAPQRTHVDAAVAAARAALPRWSRVPFDTRAAVLRRFADLAKQHAGKMTELLIDEIGKVAWEAKGEAGILAGKVDITLEAPDKPESGLRRVTGFELPLSATRAGRCMFRPHGVMAVLGPFNFPAHLPNGHIVPALLTGNTVVLKPSDKAPAVGQLLAELYDQALRDVLGGGYIPGVVNLVQGDAPIAAALAGHADLDAIAFTGSWPVGRRILEANLDRPARLVALEMGGSNPAVVLEDADLKQAAIEIVRCAFNTTGQRCTCTRRVVAHKTIADRLVKAIAKAASNLIIGEPRAKHPVFTGPIISEAGRRAVLRCQAACARAGAEVVVPAVAMEEPNLRGGFYLTPSVVRVGTFSAQGPAGGSFVEGPDFDPGGDFEVFGPLLRVCEVGSVDEAIQQANATRFGLAASIFTRDGSAAERFLHEARAGCVNWNTGTAGASSKLPFGGLGLSGNHRPAGSFALDYTAVPVAAMLERGSAATIAEGMRFEDAWVAEAPR